MAKDEEGRSVQHTHPLLCGAVICRQRLLVRRMALCSSTPGLRHTCASESLAAIPDGLAELKELFAWRLAVPGMQLRSLDGWNSVVALIAMPTDRLKPAAAKAGIGVVGWHTFRHTYSTVRVGTS